VPNVGDHRGSGSIQADLIFDEIRAIVADAIKTGTTLSIAPHVERLAKTYGTSGISKGRIADEIIIAATQASVPVRIEHIR
jgi:hypothetical protein